MMRKPSLFIAGVPKAGTTSLSEYLREHPQVCISRPKEPHFFAEDFPGIRVVRCDDDYLNLFSHARDGQILGEASATYLYSSVALKNIYTFNPGAKVIVMLRNPVEMVQSLHGEFLLNGFEDIVSFEEAWNQQAIRRVGKSIPKTCLEPLFLQYRDFAGYGNQLERLFAIFPKDQVKVILFDDFVTSPRDTYLKLLQFLGLEDDQRTEFPKFNPRQQTKSKFLAQLTRYLYATTKDLYPLLRAVKERIGLNKISFFQLLQQANREKASVGSLTPEFRAVLVSEFSDEVMGVSKLLNKNLEHWV